MVVGDRMNSEIVNYMKHNHNLIIGERTAETVKIKIGTAYPEPDNEKKTMEVRGRDSVSGMPTETTITAAEVEIAIHDTVEQIVAAAKAVLETTPPELAADIIDRGIMLTGGGALLDGIDKLFSERLTVPVIISEDPLDNVAKGAGVLLEHMDTKTAKENN